MPTHDSAGDSPAGSAPKKHWSHYFLREDYDPDSRPTLERSEGGRAQRRLDRKTWEREHGGRFHTWVYVVALIVVLGAWALLILT